MTDWSSLASDPLLEIARRLPTVFDYARFRAVCRSWRSAASPSDLPSQFPWLLLPHDPNADGRPFFSPVTGTTHSLRFPEARGERLCGSGHGWLLFVGDTTNTLTLTLLHPLTGSRAPLPPLDIQAGNHVRKAFISSSPTSSSGCVVSVLAGFTDKLHFCRVCSGGCSRWSEVRTGLRDSLCDVAYRDSKFYAIGSTGLLTICDVGTQQADAAVVLVPPPCADGWFMGRLHLVESSSELLMVVLYEYWGVPEHVDRRDFLGVFRLEEGHRQPRWVSVGSVPERAIFASELGSFSVDVDGLPGCRGDGLWLVSCNPEGDEGSRHVRVSVMDLKSGSMELIQVKHESLIGSQLLDSWFVPTLC